MWGQGQGTSEARTDIAELDLTYAARAAGRDAELEYSRDLPYPRHRLVLVVLLAVLATAVLGAVIDRTSDSQPVGVLAGPVRLSALSSPTGGADTFRGLAAWVDVYDYAPAYQDPGQAPVVGPDSLAVMRAAGVRTLFLQTAGTDSRTPDNLADPALAGEFLAAAHRHGMRVVGWYAPTLADPDRDLARLRSVTMFETDGDRFDGVAVDIEPAGGDPAARSARLVDLSRRLSQLAGQDIRLAAITPAPVVLEDVNPQLWPDFPWQQLAGIYDVWIPMNYWTLRSGPDRDPATFTRENLRRLRLRLGNPLAPVHALGGVGDAVTEGDAAAFLEAAEAEGALGASIYDHRSLSVGATAVLWAGVPPGGFGARVPGDHELRE